MKAQNKIKKRPGEGLEADASETVPRRNEKRQRWRQLSASDHHESHIPNISRSNLQGEIS